MKLSQWEGRSYFLRGASEEDIRKLKDALPNQAVEWTQPDEATIAKTKAAFLEHFEKQKK